MISEPDKYIDDFVKAGADNISSRGSLQSFASDNSDHKQNVKAAVALNPAIIVNY